MPKRQITQLTEKPGLILSSNVKTIAEGRYEIIKELGSGAYGRVMLGKETEITELSDDTAIGNSVWRELKSEIMQEDYKSQIWYTETEKG